MLEAKPLRLIGQAAALSGLSAASIRFYEKEGLLAPGQRLAELRERCDGSGPQCRIMEALHQRAQTLPPDEPRTRGHRHV